MLDITDAALGPQGFIAPQDGWLSICSTLLEELLDGTVAVGLGGALGTPVWVRGGTRVTVRLPVTTEPSRGDPAPSTSMVHFDGGAKPNMKVGQGQRLGFDARS